MENNATAHRCRTIAVANQKGGVGKTTSTFNIATGLWNSGYTVLMIDMDPQYSLTQACGFIPDDPERGNNNTCRLFTKCDPTETCFTVDSLDTDTFYLVPSTQQLAVTSQKLFSQKGSIATFIGNIRKLEEIFDYIVMDLGPSLDPLMTAALCVPDVSVLIPCKPEFLSYNSLSLISATIDGIKNAPDGQPNNPTINLLGVIATMCRKNTLEHKEYLEKINMDYDLIGTVSLSTSILDGMGEGLPAIIKRPRTAAAKDYRKIVDAIISRG